MAENNKTPLTEEEKKSAETTAKKDEKPAEDKKQAAAKPAGDKNFSEKVWQPILRPIVTLMAICLVTSLLLGLTNSLTAPIIEQNATLEADNARKALLPEATGFTLMELEGEPANVSAAYESDNGVGWIIDCFAKGYGGDVPAMVAFGTDGNIAGVTFLQNNETPGLGKKLETEAWFREQFAGLPAEAISLGSVEKIASSTISTGAAVTAINAAITVFKEQIMGEEAGELTFEQQVGAVLPGATLEGVDLSGQAGVQPGAWVDRESGSVIVFGEAAGMESTVVAGVAIDADGVILALWPDTSGETPGIGTPIQEDAAFISGFVGQTGTDGVETIAGSTITCDAVIEAVNNALAAAPAAAGAPTNGETLVADSSSPKPAVGTDMPQVAAWLLPGAALEEVAASGDGVQAAAWVDKATGNVVVVGEAAGMESTVVAATAIDANGAVLGLWLDTSGETPGIGTPIQDDNAFIASIIGQTSADGADMISGSTITCKAVAEAVNNALAAAPAVQEVG